MSSQKQRLLIVDDEPDLLEVLTLYLQTADYIVETADCGNDALARLKDTTRPGFAWVLTDMRMPNGTGLELLAGMKALALKPEPKLLVISGYADVSEPEVVKLGAVGLLTKPVNFSKLVSLLEGGK